MRVVYAHRRTTVKSLSAAPEPHDHIIRPRKGLDRALSGTIITNIALALLGAVTGILCARLLGPSGEGKLTAIQAWPTTLGTIAILGLDFSVVYFISRQQDRGRQLTSTAILVALAPVLVMDTVAWFALPFLLSAQSPQVVSAARVFLLIGLIYVLVVIPRGSLRGAKEFTTWNLSRITPSLAWLCILVTSRLDGHASAIPLSRLYLAAVFICGLPFLFISDQRLKGPLKPDVHLAPKMLRFGLPTALTSLPQTVNLQLDQLLMVEFLPSRSLGLYVIAVSWSGAAAPLLSAIGSVLYPNVSAERDTRRQAQLLAASLQGGVIVAVLTSALFMLLAPVGLPFVFGPRFASSIPSALVLVPAGAIFAWAGIAEEGLRGLGRPTIILIAEISAAVVTVATLPVLLHEYGIFGAAVASLLGYSAIAAFCVVVISRSTHVAIRSLVIPSWPTTKSLLLRSVSFVLKGDRIRNGGRHRK